MILLAGAMLGPIYALFVEEIGGNLLDASFAGGMFALAAGITTFISGKYSDKIKENEEYKKWSSKVFSNLLDSDEIQEKDRVPAAGGTPATSGEDESNKTDQQYSKVSIRDFHVKSDRLSPNIIDFRYTLFNNDENHERISGHITTIACTRDTDPPIYRTFPNVRMRNGIPINYREGQFFAIRYQKPVTGRIQILDEKEKFKEIFVFVYSVKGELLLEKSFELNEQ